MLRSGFSLLAALRPVLGKVRGDPAQAGKRGEDDGDAACQHHHEEHEEKDLGKCGLEHGCP